MALISCDNCGKEVSDQAETCIHCGATIKKEFTTSQEETTLKPSESSESETPITITCPECGNETPANNKNCTKCGFPLEKDQGTQMQPDETSGGEKPKGKKKTAIIVIVSIIVLIVLGSVIGFNLYQQQQERAAEEAAAQAQAEALAAEQAAVTAYNEYISNANQITTMMLIGAAQAEELCNTIRNVWNSAIWKNSKSEWDKDIQKYYASDFNDALAKLFKDKDIQKDTQSLEDNQDNVESVYAKLQTVPDSSLDRLRNSIEDLYDEYIRFTNLAINPTGSYQTYSQDTNEADSDFMTEYKKIKSKIPEEKPMPNENDVETDD